MAATGKALDLEWTPGAILENVLDLVRCLRDTGMPIETLRRFAELVRSGDDTMPDRVALLEDYYRSLGSR